MDKSKLSELMVKVKNDRDQIAFSNLFDFLAPKLKAYFIQNGLSADISEELTQLIYHPNRKYKIFETSHDSSFDPKEQLRLLNQQCEKLAPAIYYEQALYLQLIRKLLPDVVRRATFLVITNHEGEHLNKFSTQELNSFKQEIVEND